MANEEIRTPEGQLDDLDQKLTSGLRHGVIAQPTSVPLARPPRAVRFVVLELARQEDRDEDLVDGTLDEDDSDETEDGMCDVP